MLPDGTVCVPAIVNYSQKNQFVTTKNVRDTFINTSGYRPPMAPNTQSLNGNIVNDLNLTNNYALWRDYYPWNATVMYSKTTQVIRWNVPDDGRNIPIATFPTECGIFFNGPLEDALIFNNGVPFFENELAYTNEVGVYYQNKQQVVYDCRGMIRYCGKDTWDNSWNIGRNAWIMQPNTATVICIRGTPFTIAPDLPQNNTYNLKTVFLRVFLQMTFNVAENPVNPGNNSIGVTSDGYGREFGLDNPLLVTNLPIVSQ